MAKNFVARRFEQSGLVVRFAGVYVGRGHHPQAHPFLSSGVDVSRHLHGVFGVTGVKTAAMAVF
jgi:hypothetical protein